MDVLVLGNITALSLQIAVLTITGAILHRILGIKAPVIRHAYWRFLLMCCLLLPVIQPWRNLTATDMSESMEFVASTVAITAPASAGAAPSMLATLLREARANWPIWILVALSAGAAIRLAWIGLGVARLRRLRNRGTATTPSTPGACDESIAIHQAGAEVRYVAGLGQPVTFGLIKPVVLLPVSFDELPLSVQRAVLAHELWHIRRRDWGWLVAEELLRAAFWFHPAMWWLISQVQQSREEVVDELSVQLTSSRRGYLEALLAFADQPPVFPAAPFARRRHLFQRMLLISTEGFMSSRRIVATSVSTAVMVVAAGWFGTSSFPLKSISTNHLLAGTAPQAQVPPRDRRPTEAGPETAMERELKRSIQAEPTRMVTYLQLAKLQEDRKAIGEAEATLVGLRRALPNDKDAVMVLASLYNRTGQFEKTIETLEGLVAMDPSNPQAYQLIATFYGEKAFKDTGLSAADRVSYIRAGVTAAERALERNPNYVESLIYKAMLLRMQANLETDGSTRQSLNAEAYTLATRAQELKEAGVGGSAERMTFVPAPGQRASGPPPPPPPPPPAPDESGMAPVRVGGSIKSPRKLRDVRPEYPPIAIASKIQGVVILETTIDTNGRVMTARVLRSVPLLDEAALQAVSQWEFEPTLVNGVPTSVIMTTTVNFQLPTQQ